MPTALARRFKVDVSTDNTVWVPFKGLNDFNNQINPGDVSSDTYDTNGWSSFEITMQGWSLVLKALRPTTSGVFDPGQELVRATRGNFGQAARVYVRWYDRNGAPEAYSGLGIVEWNPSKTGVADLDEVTVTIKGDGILTSITNPYAAALIPATTSVTPASVAVGGIIQIVGANYTGTVVTTGVKVGATNATSWIVVSDSLIVAVMPAGSAGATTVTVTNAAGAGNAFVYTRGA